MEKIKDNLPLISATLLIIGALKTVMYYTYFGIDISQYIELSELITLSVRFMVAQFILLSFTILYFSFFLDTDDLRQFINNQSAIATQSSIQERIKIYYKEILGSPGIIFITAPLSMILFGVVGNYYFNTQASIPFTSMGLFIIALIFFKIIISEILIKYQQHNNTQVNISTVINIAFFITLTLSASIFGVSTAWNVINLHRYEKAVAIFDNDVKVSSSFNYRYIGKTKGFIFFYNIKNKTADAYLTDDLKAIKTGRFTTFQKDSINWSKKPKALSKPLNVN